MLVWLKLLVMTQLTAIPRSGNYFFWNPSTHFSRPLALEPQSWLSPMPPQDPSPEPGSPLFTLLAGPWSLEAETTDLDPPTHPLPCTVFIVTGSLFKDL